MANGFLNRKFEKDGHSLVFDRFGAGRRRLVFLHGLCGKKELWIRQVEMFSRAYEVIAVDLLGHGKSSAIAPDIAFQANVEILKNFLGAMDKLTTIVIGHSWAGSMVNRLIKESENVNAFVFVDSPCVTDPKSVKEYTTWGNVFLEQEDPREFVKNDWFGSMLSKSPSEKNRKLVLAPLEQVDLRWLSKVMEKFPMPSKYLTNKKVLIADGAQFFPKGCPNSWVNFYPNAERWEYSDHGHFYFLEDPTSFNDKLESFISTVV